MARLPASLVSLRSAVRTRAAPRPGVYRLLDEDGEVLYVGQSGQVRRRLLGYFDPQRATRAKTAQVLGETERIELEYLPSPSAALHREHQLIKRHRPVYNVEGKPPLTVRRVYNKSRPIVRGVTVVAGAVGAVNLNRRYPEGLDVGIARVQASTAATIAAFGGALIARKLDMPRAALTLVDLGIGGMLGSLGDAAVTGKPLVAARGAGR